MLNVGTKVKVKPEFLVGENAQLFKNHIAVITKAYDSYLGPRYSFEYGNDVDITNFKCSKDIQDKYKRMFEVFGEECFEIIE